MTMLVFVYAMTVAERCGAVATGLLWAVTLTGELRKWSRGRLDSRKR